MIKKLARSFAGVCELRQLQYGIFFRLAEANHNYVYYRWDYNRSKNRYACLCVDTMDVVYLYPRVKVDTRIKDFDIKKGGE